MTGAAGKVVSGVGGAETSRWANVFGCSIALYEAFTPSHRRRSSVDGLRGAGRLTLLHGRGVVSLPDGVSLRRTDTGMSGGELPRTRDVFSIPGHLNYGVIVARGVMWDWRVGGKLGRG